MDAQVVQFFVLQFIWLLIFLARFSRQILRPPLYEAISFLRIFYGENSYENKNGY
jgi:hypothetical protein